MATLADHLTMALRWQYLTLPAHDLVPRATPGTCETVETPRGRCWLRKVDERWEGEEHYIVHAPSDEPPPTHEGGGGAYRLPMPPPPPSSTPCPTRAALMADAV